MKKNLFLLLPFLFSCSLYGQQSISLEECLKLAMEHNQKIKIAQNQVKAAEAIKRSAFTQYLPNFSITGAYTYLNKDYKLLDKDLFLPVVPYTAIDPATGGLNQAALSNPAVASSTFVINPSTGAPLTDAQGNPVFQKYTYLPASKAALSLDNVTIVNGGFIQPLYAGGKIREANRIANYTKDIASGNLSLSEQELKYSVEEAYWRIVSVREKVVLAGKYREMLTRLVNDLQNIRTEGIITDNDLLKAKLKLSESEMQLLKATNGLEMSKMVLCQMTGIQYSSSLVFSDSLNHAEFNLSQISPDESSVANRPELLILGKNVDIARSTEKLMISRFLPDIALTAGYTFMNPDPYNGLKEQFGSDYNIGVALNIPVFHFGDRKHTLDAAKYEKESAEMKLQESKEMIMLELQQAIYRYNESVKKTDYAKQAVDQSGANLKFTDDNFREGRLKITDLLEAQLLWQKSYSELIDSRTEQQLAVSNLKRVTVKY